MSVTLKDLGLKPYREAWDIQQGIFDAIVARKIANRELPENEQTPTQSEFLFVEHPHVYTLGKSGDTSNMLLDENTLKEKGATFIKVNRGGDITYHGPGQVVGYPILDLDNFFTDIHLYLRKLEDVIINTIAEYGLKGERSEGETGVWLDVGKPSARKICAMGVRTSRWVTMHGFALNVNSNLAYFDYIVPCGIKGKAVASMHAELGQEIDQEEIKEKIKKHFQEIFNTKLITEA